MFGIFFFFSKDFEVVGDWLIFIDEVVRRLFGKMRTGKTVLGLKDFSYFLALIWSQMDREEVETST